MLNIEENEKERGVGGEEREGGNRKGRRRRKTGKVVLTVNNGWEDVGSIPY